MYSFQNIYIVEYIHFKQVSQLNIYILEPSPQCRHKTQTYTSNHCLPLFKGTTIKHIVLFQPLLATCQRFKIQPLIRFLLYYFYEFKGSNYFPTTACHFSKVYLYLSLSIYMYIFLSLYTYIYIYIYTHTYMRACGPGPAPRRSAPTPSSSRRIPARD